MVKSDTRMVVEVPEEVFRRFKAAVVLEGKTIREVIIKEIEKYIKKSELGDKDD